MREKPNIYEIAMLVLCCTLCLFIITEVIIMALIPTNTENIEVRKQMMSIINFVSGGIMGILTSKIIEKTKNN